MRIPRVETVDKMIMKLYDEGAESMPQILLGAMIPDSLHRLLVESGFGDKFRISSYVEYIHLDRVLAKTRKG